MATKATNTFDALRQEAKMIRREERDRRLLEASSNVATGGSNTTASGYESPPVSAGKSIRGLVWADVQEDDDFDDGFYDPSELHHNITDRQVAAVADNALSSDESSSESASTSSEDDDPMTDGQQIVDDEEDAIKQQPIKQQLSKRQQQAQGLVELQDALAELGISVATPESPPEIAATSGREAVESHVTSELATQTSSRRKKRSGNKTATGAVLSPPGGEVSDHQNTSGDAEVAEPLSRDEALKVLRDKSQKKGGAGKGTPATVKEEAKKRAEGKKSKQKKTEKPHYPR